MTRTPPSSRPSARTEQAHPDPVPDLAATPLDTAQILASIGEVAYEWQVASDVLAWGPNFRDVLKIADPQLVASGRNYAKLLIGDNAQTRFDAVTRATTRDEGEGVSYEVQYCLSPQPGGDKMWIEDTGRWFAGPDGRPARAHGIVRVINDRRAREERLAFLSRFDGLTGEMNRWCLTDLLTTTLDDTIRFRSSCGFLIVAIENLARINEAYGFDVADEVIAAVAKRLRARMRGGDSLGRFSGNKFGVILKQCTPEDITTAADRLLAGVREEVVQTKAGPVAVTASIGGVNAPRHARTVHEVLSRAQEALATAQQKRRGSFQAFLPNVERDALRRETVRSTDEIVSALNERRILTAFEPVVDAVSRVPVFYECLMRVRRSDGVLVPTKEIIPVAERLGLVRLLDHRVLELLIEELATTPDLQASVNVSAASTADPDWWAALSAQLRARSGIAERLIIEITETAAIHNVEDTHGFVVRAKDLGCRIAIDDFGAGNTSFRNLRKLGVDIVKIDGAFVENLTRSEDDRVFVHTLIDLARRLGLKTVAECVQEEDAAALLKAWGCDCLQGLLIGLARLERPWLAPARKRSRKSSRH